MGEQSCGLFDNEQTSFRLHLDQREQVLPALFCYAGKGFGIYETATPCLVSLVKGLEKALSGISI